MENYIAIKTYVCKKLFKIGNVSDHNIVKSTIYNIIITFLCAEKRLAVNTLTH